MSINRLRDPLFFYLAMSYTQCSIIIRIQFASQQPLAPTARHPLHQTIPPLIIGVSVGCISIGIFAAISIVLFMRWKRKTGDAAANTRIKENLFYSQINEWVVPQCFF